MRLCSDATPNSQLRRCAGNCGIAGQAVSAPTNSSRGKRIATKARGNGYADHSSAPTNLTASHCARIAPHGIERQDTHTTEENKVTSTRPLAIWPGRPLLAVASGLLACSRPRQRAHWQARPASWGRAATWARARCPGARLGASIVLGAGEGQASSRLRHAQLSADLSIRARLASTRPCQRTMIRLYDGDSEGHGDCQCSNLRLACGPTDPPVAPFMIARSQ